MAIASKTEEKIVNRVLERVDSRAGLNQLGTMVGLQSTKSATDWEAKAVADETADIRKELFCQASDDTAEAEAEGEEPMRDILATGPVYINSPQTESSTEETEQPAPVQPTQPAVRPPMSKPLAWGLGAAALLSALTLPILAYNITRPEPPAETPAVNIGARFVPVPDDFTK